MGYLCHCRHCLLSTGPMLSERMWHIAVRALRHAMDVSVYCLHQLMTPFDAFSDNFYGDIGHVKVGVRKGCTGIEAERLRQLAQQVWVMKKCVQETQLHCTCKFEVELPIHVYRKISQFMNWCQMIWSYSCISASSCSFQQITHESSSFWPPDGVCADTVPH